MTDSNISLRLSRRRFLSASLGGMLLPQYATATAPRSGGHLRMWVGSLRGASSLAHCAPARRCWGETLTESTADGDAVMPLLAERWSTSDGGLRWAFKIRQRVRFHDGRLLDARDVVASLQRLEPRDRHWLLPMVEEIAVIGSHSVGFRLRKAMSEFPMMLSDSHLVIQPHDLPDPGTVGTGPYRCRPVAPDVVVMERFAESWRAGVGHVESIELRRVSDASERVKGIAEGRVDLIDDVPRASMSFLASTGQVFEKLGRHHLAFVFDIVHRPLAEPMTQLLNTMGWFRELQARRGEGLPVLARSRVSAADTDIPALGTLPTLHLTAALHPRLMQALPPLQNAVLEQGQALQWEHYSPEAYWTQAWRRTPWFMTYSSGRRTIAQNLYQLFDFAADNAWLSQQIHDIAALPGGEQRDASLAHLARTLPAESGWHYPVFFRHRDAAGLRVAGFEGHHNGALMDAMAGIKVWLK